MANRAGVRALARAELNDGGAVLLWSDGLLNEWLLEAIRDYGRRLPREATQTISSVVGQADYSLATDCQRVARVEHPSGFFRVPDPLSAGDLVDPFQVSQGLPRAVAEQLSYEVWGPPGAQVLSLRPAPTAAGESIKVRYLAGYAEPATDADTLATPAGDDQLLIWSICARALHWLGLDESKRQRWERQRGVSAAGQAEVYRAAYQAEPRLRQQRTAPRRLVVRA